MLLLFQSTTFGEWLCFPRQEVKAGIIPFLPTKVSRVGNTNSFLIMCLVYGLKGYLVLFKWSHWIACLKISCAFCLLLSYFLITNFYLLIIKSNLAQYSIPCSQVLIVMSIIQCDQLKASRRSAAVLKETSDPFSLLGLPDMLSDCKCSR